MKKALKTKQPAQNLRWNFKNEKKKHEKFRQERITTLEYENRTTIY